MRILEEIKNTIDVKGIIWEDIVNYKKISTTIMCSKCNFKCDKENGVQLCQNWGLAAAPTQTVPIDDILDRHVKNPLTEAIVMQGLEPFDTPFDIYTVAAALKDFKCKDDLVIYTGYNKSEINPAHIQNLLFFLPGDLIIKYGRYIPNQTPHYDEILGVKLASDNQFAEIYTHE